jgi:competence protein ComEC
MIDPPHWPGSAPAVEPLRFRRAPLLASALAFAAGDALARPAEAWRPAVMMLLWVLLLGALTLYARLRYPSAALFPALALWMVAGFWSAEMQPAPPSQADVLRSSDGLQRKVRGHIVRIRELPPESADEGSEKQEASAVSVDLAIDAIEEVTPDVSRMLPAVGGVRLTITNDNAPSELRCGEGLEATLRLRTPERYRDPGAWQYADYLAEQGIGASATVAASKVMLTPREPGKLRLQCGVFAAQTWAADRLTAFTGSLQNRRLPVFLRLTSDDAGMLNAMLFGERDRLSHTLRLGFERTGSFHLFVVSGMHVALLAGAWFYLCRKLRLSQGIATVATIAATAGYAVLTGFGVPVQRALLMSSIFLVARLLHRDRNVMNSLGAAALVVLVLSPSSLFEASFQMTFLVIVAIGGIAIPLGEWSFLPYARAARNLDYLWLDMGVHPRLAQFRIRLRLWGEHLELLLGEWAVRLPGLVVRVALWTLELLLIGIVAEMVMVLPMAAYFHRATIFALPANVVSIPLVAILAPMAGVTFLASLISPWLAVAPASATALLLHTITGVISGISRLHAADWRIPGPCSAVFMAAVLCWLMLCWLVRRSQKSAMLAGFFLPVVAAIILWPEPAIRTPNEFEVTAIDVGQGDSLLLVSPEGQTILVDAGGPVGRGENARLQTKFDVGEDVVSPYLWSRRIRRLDIVALTHAHSDHMGGMAAILRNFRPRELWVGIDPDSQAYRELLDVARDLGIRIVHLHASDAEMVGGIRFSVLAPSVDYRNTHAPVNNDSLVLRADFGKASVLLEGDAEAPSERAMLAAGDVHPVTLLKVGHHGSRTSTTPDFFAAVQPQMAVISVGKDNTFGHPRPEVIEQMAEAGVRVYRTDRFGLTQFLLTKDGRIREIGLWQALP